MADQWFYRIGENQYGPVKSAELAVLAESEMISRSTLVRRADEDRWVRAGKIAELFGGAGEPSEARAPRAKSRTGSSPRTSAAKPSQQRRAARPEKTRSEDKPKSASLPPRPKPARPRVGPETVSASAAATPRPEEDFVDVTDDEAGFDEPTEFADTVADEPETFAPAAGEPAIQVAAPQFRQPAAASRSPRGPRRTKSSNQSKLIILSSLAVVGCLLLFVGVFFAAKQLAGGSSTDLAQGSDATDADKNNDDNNEPPRPAIEPGEFIDPTKPSNDPPLAHLTSPQFIKKYEKSVVRIQVITAQGGGVGSGFVAKPNGIVVTNYHVVKDARTAKAEFNSFHQFATYDVEGILYFDATIDIAVIKLKTSKNLPCLELARQPPEKGEELMVFGAPDGKPFVCNPGAVTAVHEASVLHRDNPNLTGYWIQTDAKVWHGNSGGPMMSRQTQKVVGVTTWGKPDVPGANYGSAAQNIAVALKAAKVSQMVPLGSAELAGRIRWPE